MGISHPPSLGRLQWVAKAKHDVNELLSGAQLIKSKVSSFLKSFKDIHLGIHGAPSTTNLFLTGASRPMSSGKFPGKISHHAKRTPTTTSARA
ncbi:uncharacterized protein LAJ45_09280 [Morchella importuna]|uniref:uncharacterized protein n=1 Tax=Morchella importuna TaxID=1174673 RepID=UPI001E8CABF4|nr:uncharacterized protein LAJ45_09280 [Morchella importuna]KAH8146597.1 hypothetical protein LAJ45_09280 [Morchella importuna]